VSGLLIEAFGLIFLSQASADWSPLALAFGAALTGGGLGLFTVPNMSIIMRLIGENRQGVGGALTLLTRTVGIVIAASGLSALFAASELSKDFFGSFEVVFATVAAIVILVGAIEGSRRLASDS
jgi:hypothetical protein